MDGGAMVSNKHEVLTASEPYWFPEQHPGDESGEEYAKLFAKESVPEMSLVVHCTTRQAYEYGKYYNGKNEDSSFHEPIGTLSGTSDEIEGTLVSMELDSDDDISAYENANSDPIPEAMEVAPRRQPHEVAAVQKTVGGGRAAEGVPDCEGQHAAVVVASKVIDAGATEMKLDEMQLEGNKLASLPQSELVALRARDRDRKHGFVDGMVAVACDGVPPTERDDFHNDINTLSVNDFAGATRTIHVEPVATVAELKTRIQMKVGINLEIVLRLLSHLRVEIDVRFHPIITCSILIGLNNGFTNNL